MYVEVHMKESLYIGKCFYYADHFRDLAAIYCGENLTFNTSFHIFVTIEKYVWGGAQYCAAVLFLEASSPFVIQVSLFFLYLSPFIKTPLLNYWMYHILRHYCSHSLGAIHKLRHTNFMIF